MNEREKNSIKPCCIFSYENATTAIKHFKYYLVKNLGEEVFNEDGTVKHYTYAWDEGGRKVICCIKCGAIFIHQWTEFHSFTSQPDSYYENYFLVKDLDEALNLNNTYSGFALEMKFKGLQLWTSRGNWVWNKEDK